MREWRGRMHPITVRFGNIRDRDSMPDASLYAAGESWRIVVDYPFDTPDHSRRSDMARIERLDQGSRTVFWLPLFLTDDQMGRVAQLAKINYLLWSGDRLTTLAADWSLADRAQGKVYLQQRQQQLRSTLLDCAQAGLRRGEGSTIRCGDRRDRCTAYLDRGPASGRPAGRHVAGGVRQPDRRPAGVVISGHARPCRWTRRR